MKNTITILTFFVLFLSIAQDEDNVIFEYMYHPNGKLHLEFQYDTILNCYAGIYKEYDTTGAIIVEGKYKIVDSVKCKECYDGHPDLFQEEVSWNKYAYVDLRHIPEGEWKYYYSNGQIKMKGTYSEKVHYYSGRPFIQKPINKPVNVWGRYDLLKNGKWENFDENGKKKSIEYYIDGSLIYKIKS